MKFFDSYVNRVLVLLIAVIGILSSLDELKEYSLMFTINFYVLLFLMIYINRRFFETDGKLFYLLRTKFGLKWMDRTAKKSGRTIKILGFIGLVVGYAGMVFMTYLMMKQLYDVVRTPTLSPGISPILPGVEIQGIGVFPLIIGWISLFIIMVVHEFSHGLVARAYEIPVKSTGILFLGPILGAFVEPDDKVLEKKKGLAQLSVFAAGPFSNVVLWILIVGVMAFAMNPVYERVTDPQGYLIAPINNETLPIYSSGITNLSLLKSINGVAMHDEKTLFEVLDGIRPGETAIFVVDDKEYSIVSTTHPNNASNAYFGFTPLGVKREFKEEPYLAIAGPLIIWLSELFSWTLIISLAVGLFNLYPVFVTDGAKMLKINIEWLVKDKKKAFKVWKAVNYAGLFIIVVMLLIQIERGLPEFIRNLFFWN